MINAFSNFALNKILTFNDKDPPWMTQFLKSQIYWPNNIYQEHHSKRNHTAHNKLKIILKANFFNKFFADKCTSIQNNSVIPNFIECKLMNRLTSIAFNDESILKIIRALDVNKAHGEHGHDISIQMIKFCDKSIISAISLIYQNCIDSGISPNTWKKSNVVPVHKKGNKQVIEN